MLHTITALIFSVLLTFSKEDSPLGSNIDKGECFEWEVEYHGGGLDNPLVTGVTSAEWCQLLCQDREGCNYFTWVNSQHDVVSYQNTCWLKSSQGTPQSCPTCVSGPRSCGTSSTTRPPNTCCETVSITSSGDTPDYQWTRLGTFYLYDNSGDGRPMYRQEPGQQQNYLYYLDWLGVWYVNDNPLQNMGGLINWGDAWCPADLEEHWSFYRWGDGEIDDWEEDPTLRVSCVGNEPTKPTTTTTTEKTTVPTMQPTTHPTRTPSPDAEPCSWGSACDGCDQWAEMDGVRYCCASQCDWGDVYVWTDDGQVWCECYH